MKKILFSLYFCNIIHPMQTYKAKLELIDAIQKKDHAGVVGCLVAGARVNDESNPLLQAVRVEDEKICTLLLAQGANPNGWNNSKDPLLTAVKKQNSSLCALLLEWGADPYGKGLLYRAARQSNQKIYQLLSDFSVSVYWEHGILDELILFKQSNMIPAVITQSNINRPLSPESFKKFLQSHKRIATILCIFKHYCPHMPKDIKKLIFQDPALQENLVAALKFGKLQEIKVKEVRDLPIELVRYLIQLKYLDPQTVINQLTNATIEHFKHEAEWALTKRSNIDYSTWKRLNPNRLGQKYNTQIQETLRRRLLA